MKILVFTLLMVVASVANAMHGGGGARFSGGDHGGDFHGGNYNGGYHGGYYGDRGGYYNNGGGVSVDWGLAPEAGYLADPYYPYPYNPYNLNETDNYANPMY